MLYKTIVTYAVYVYTEPGVLDFKEIEDEQKTVETHDTIAQALESMDTWGSRWVMYPSVHIENEKGEDVWSHTLIDDTCPTCGRGDYDYITGGLYTMTDKDGKKLFPELV